MSYIEFNNVNKNYKMGEITINALNNVKRTETTKVITPGPNEKLKKS